MIKTIFGPLKLIALNRKQNLHEMYELADDFYAIDPVRGKIVVPKGYVTDLYSAPIGFGWLTHGLRPEPAILHDYVNARGVTDVNSNQQKWSTGIFNRAMKSVGIPFWRRIPILLYVVIFTFPERIM